MSTRLMPWIVGLAIGWLSLALGLLVFRLVRRQWYAWRYGPPVNHAILLAEFGRQMTGAANREALATLLVSDIPRSFGVQRAALLLPQNHDLITMHASLGETDADLRVPVSHAAVRWVASAGEAQRADQGRLHALIRQGPATLAWTRAWIPLMRGADLRGMWLLGERDGHALFAAEDLRCLTSLGRQTAAVLEAARYADQERQTTEELRALYRQVVNAQELERGHLARELHDGVLQDLCAVVRDLRAVEARSAKIGRLPEDLVNHAADTVHALRAICNDLRPPLLQQDLATALTALVKLLDARSPAPVHIEINASDLRLPDEVAVALFRITQEALHNAIRHADASEIAVRLTQYPDRLRLTVTDDGRGIPDGVEPARFVAQGHFGVAGMRERAAMIGASLDVQTAVDYGTVVVLVVPRRPA